MFSNNGVKLRKSTSFESVKDAKTVADTTTRVKMVLALPNAPIPEKVRTTQTATRPIKK